MDRRSNMRRRRPGGGAIGGGDPTLAILFARSQIAGRDGSLTILRNTERVCPVDGATKAATGASAVALTTANACTGTLTGGGLSLPLVGAFGQRTNLFLNSDTPATQSVTVATGSVVVFPRAGTGYTVTTAAGTAVGSGFGAVAVGSSQVLTITGAGTVTVTISGTPVGGRLSVEQAAFPGPYIPTAGAAVTHDADQIDWTGFGGLDPVSGEIAAVAIPYLWSQAAGTGALPGGSVGVIWDDKSGNNSCFRGATDTARRYDAVPSQRSATASTLADASGVSRVMTTRWSGAGVDLYRGATLAANNPTFTAPWSTPTTLGLGTRIGAFPWFGLVGLIYVPGGMTASERAAFAAAFGGKTVGFVA